MSFSPRADGLGNVINSIPNIIFTTSNLSKIGQVIGIVNGEDLPTPKQYNRANKVIGSVIYAKVDTNGPIEITDSFDDKLYDNYDIAQPFFSSVIDYPSANAEIEGKAINTYYIGTISVWGSPQHNSVANYNLGATYLVNPNIKSLLPFDGDRIFQGRQGSALRFSSTTKLYNDKNELLVVGKLSTPYPIPQNTDITFIIRWDS